MKTMLIAILTLMATEVYAADPWSKQDIALEVTCFAFHLIINWGQTRDLVTRRDQGFYEELNPLLGKHPTMTMVDSYFIGSSLLHLGITHILPKEASPYFQVVRIGIAGTCVIKNLSVGLNMRFGESFKLTISKNPSPWRGFLFPPFSPGMKKSPAGSDF